MRKTILTFGAISGALIFGVFFLGTMLAMSGGAVGKISELLGYLLMLVTLSVIFVGIKRYRDRELGGVIRFGQALLVGVGISLVAGVLYVACWEIYLNATGFAFIDEYTRAVVEGKKAAGMAGEELQALVASIETVKQRYANPLSRLPMIFLEIFPFGIVISLTSAAILRSSKFLPAAT